MIVDRILQAAEARARQRGQRPAKLGAWNVGSCVRKLWYMEHGAPAEPLQARALLTFDLGDRVEDAVLHWLQESGHDFIRTNEARDMVYVPELGCRVRADFVFACDLEPVTVDTRLDGLEPPPRPGELIVGEVKSMSDFAFERACRGTVDETYLCQMETYMRAYDTRHALLVAYRKATSHVHEVLIPRSEARWAACLEKAAVARGADCPERPYGLDAACRGCGGSGRTEKAGKPHKACGGSGREPGGPYLAVMPCGYCPHKTPCWGPVELVERAGKPRWRLAVGADPAPAETLTAAEEVI